VKGLLLRLSALDADAEAAVRVIAYFDRLVERAATPSEVVRATAALAECAVGWAPSGGTGTLRFAPNGVAVAAEVPVQASGSAPVDPADSASTARVWLERPGAPAPLDDLVLERLALTARLLGTTRRRTPAPDLADPALVELVLAEREAQEDRARAVHLLGLAAGRPVRVLAVRPAPGRDPIAEAVALVGRGRAPHPVRVAAIGEVAAVLLQPPAGADPLPPELRAALTDLAAPGGTSTAGGEAGDRAGSTGAGTAVGTVAALGGTAPPLDARRSWSQAQLALRFAVPGTADTAFVEHDGLGALALLAELPAQRLRTDPDVLALDALATTRAGALDVAALEAFSRTGSLRQAATELHLHHSSVAARLARVEQAVGWRLDTPGDRFRARLALLARRLAGSG
jgi:PucR C-terminal helix-turn-helix domain